MSGFATLGPHGYRKFLYKVILNRNLKWSEGLSFPDESTKVLKAKGTAVQKPSKRVFVFMRAKSRRSLESRRKQREQQATRAGKALLARVKDSYWTHVNILETYF